MKKISKKFQAFTLIELIVVIAIIAILATSGTLILTKRFSSARDSSRIQAISQIKTALTVSQVDKTSFTMPDDYFTVYDTGGALAWYQGYFTENTAKSIDSLQNAPQDPNTNEYYGYSVTWDKKKFQLKAELENAEAYYSYLNSTYAQDINLNKLAKIQGHFNGYVITYTGGIYYIWKVPSLFVGDMELVDADFRLTEGEMKLLADGKKLNNTTTVSGTNITDYAGSGDPVDLGGVKSTFNITDDRIAEELVKQSAGGEILKSGLGSITQSSSNCDAGSINGTTYAGISYAYDAINHGSTGVGTGTESISHGTKIYTGTVSCDDGVVSISNESINYNCDALYAWDTSACVINPTEVKLIASDGAASDLFGDSVAIDGDRVVVGARGDDSDKGGVYVYDWDGSSWVETKFIAGDGVGGDCFGWSVAVDGDRVVVGARGDDSDKGGVYVYDWDGSSWNETKLTASDGVAGDYFGYSVAVDGDRVVVGARGDDDNGSNAGAAYVYDWNGSSWVENKFIATDGAASNRYGSNVAIGGDRLAVGAYGVNSNAGAAYVYE